jgi:gliding motility-associated-like protein
LLKPDTIEGCPPLEVEMQLDITDTIDVVDYNWEIGNDITAEGSSVTQTIYEGNSNHDVTIIASSSLTGCRDTLSVPGKILVYPVPEVNFDANPSRALISNPVIRFENLTTGASGYSWDFGDQSSFSDEEQPVHRYDEMGRYDVTLKAINDMGCIDSLMAEVSVSFDQVFPPNAFSPNAVKEEDREFRIHAKGVVDDSYKLLIFNRWGQIIFESNSQEKGWNGQMKNGSFAPAGVYVWVIEYNDILGEKHSQQGTVTLIF